MTVEKCTVLAAIFLRLARQTKVVEPGKKHDLVHLGQVMFVQGKQQQLLSGVETATAKIDPALSARVVPGETGRQRPAVGTGTDAEYGGAARQ
ncbi:hypothetical protein [Pseudomonas cannabina]|uniref:hypothetical protein n=1 Tax=Pseudomonas cannabina TaxID=86840 RepID=UPI001CC3156F|nr:hypothetical protein [Pseudomonas cannabina]